MKNKARIDEILDRITVFGFRQLYKKAAVIAMVAATLLALVAKFKIALYPTNDVVGYIFRWMDEIEAVGHTNFYRIESDYSPLYLFFLNLLTFLPKGTEVDISGFVFDTNRMLALKGSYFVVDIWNAVAVYLIIRQVSGSKNKAVAGYLVMTALPVQLINSAVWGQADGIYTCFLLWSLYFALQEKGNISFLLFGFALANKLQAVFLAPFLVYMLLQRKLRCRAVICAPAAILLSFLPAYVCGAGFAEPFAFFEKQVTGYSELTLGCPNFWDLFAFRDSSAEIIQRGAVYMGLLFIGVLFAVIWLRCICNNKENLLNAAVFLTGATVFFLPHMHERYFYVVDILVVIYAFIKEKRYHLILFMQMASGIAYHSYISGRHFIDRWGEDSVHIATVMVIFVLSILFRDLLTAEHRTLDDISEKWQSRGNDSV